MPLTKPLKLLHVDDSAILRKTISKGLEPFKDDYEITQAGSVDEAMALLESGKKFDIILTDWLMAGKSGLDLLCILKSHPHYHHLPVFFLTSEYDNTNLIIAVTNGASGILKKPIAGPEVHAYFQKKTAIIEEASSFKEDLFPRAAKELIAEVQKNLPLKSSQDLTDSSLSIQNFKGKALAAKWPLLADYAQKVDDTIQASLKKEVKIFKPLISLMNDFTKFLQTAIEQIERNQAHALITTEIDVNLKNYHTSLEAGWLSIGGNAAASEKDGVFLPLEVIKELQKHLSPEAVEILRPYLKS